MLKTLSFGHVVYHEGPNPDPKPGDRNWCFDNGLRSPEQNTFTADIGNAAIYCEAEAKDRAAAINKALTDRKHPLAGRIFYGELKIKRKSAL